MVIVSLTTIPSRIGSIQRTLDSLRAQTLIPDSIRLYLDRDCGSFASPGIEVLRVQDKGPVTKISPAVDYNIPGDAIIVTADDDQEYQPDWLCTLVRASEESTGAVGLAGWNAAPLMAGGTFSFQRAPGSADVLEGFAGVAYRRSFFAADILAPPPAFHLVDDVWISSYLYRRGVDRSVVPGFRPRNLFPDRPGIHTRPDFVELNREAARIGFARQ